jgi:hypothetical protein
MKWKNKLKTVLATMPKTEKTVICLKMALTKTDKTQPALVSSAFVSDELTYFPKNFGITGRLLKCSNCDLEMNLIENDMLWFCPFGCESQKVN